MAITTDTSGNLDIANLGDFETIQDIWSIYPTGGTKGQYALVRDERYDWDEYHNRWTNGHDSDIPEVLPPNVYSGDFRISGNLECNDIDALNDARVLHNLTVGDLSKTRLLEVTGQAKVTKLLPQETVLTKDTSIHSESYYPGMLGFSINEQGEIEAKSLRLREFLEVPELRKNRISVSGNESWITDAGVVEKVEKTKDGFSITLHQQNAEGCEFQAGDLLKGIYHNGDCFNTVYLEITKIWPNGRGFDCFLPKGEQWPSPHMTLARMGNSVRPDRQGSIRLNGQGRFIQILDGITTPDIKLENIKALFGNINGVSTPGFGTLSGYGAYLTNVYACGRFVQRSGDGITESPLPVWRGDYDNSKIYYYYDLVIYQGSNYLCTRNTQYPGVTPDTPAFWQLYTSKGTDGKDAVSIEVEYSGDRQHWHTGFRYDDLYMRQRLTNGQWSQAIRIVGEQGPDGKYTDYRFAPSAIPQDKPDITPEEINPGNNWTDSPPESPYVWMTCAQLTKKLVLGNPELDFADPDNARWSDPVRITGEKGAQGDQGIPGDRGTDGTQYYTWLKYADDSEGNGMTDTPGGKKYMGIAINQTQQTESTDPTHYRWSKTEGDKGVPGTPGIDGTPRYTWVKYADDRFGAGMSDNPDGKLYIGMAYNQEEEQESTNPKSYTWVLFKGDKGDQGDKGETGDTGATGQAGATGATIRMRGEWDSAITYISNAQWRDVVLYNKSYYIVRPGLTVQNPMAPDRDNTKWEQFNEFENLATKVLLANQGNIDVLGAGELFVGQAKNGEGWKMTGGKIAHSVTGLTLTADGKIEVPPGGLTIDGNSVEQIAQQTIDDISIDGRNRLLRSGTPYTIRKFQNIENQVEYTGWFIPQECAGKKMLVSFDITFQNVVKAANSTLRFQCDPMAGYAGFNTGSVGIPANGSFHIKTYITFTTINDARSQLGIRFDYISSGLISVSNMKIEEGDKHTGWTAAPEDEREQLPIGRNLIANSSGKDTALADKRPRSIFSPTIMEVNTRRGVSIDGYYQLSPSVLNTAIGLYHQWGGWAGQNDTVAPYEDFYTLSFEYRFSERPRINSSNNALLACRAYLGVGETGEDALLCSADYNYTPGVWHRMVLTMDLRQRKVMFSDPNLFFSIRLCNLYAFFLNQFYLSFRNIKLETGNVATPWRPDDENYYLREALAGNTTIDGGLVTTSIIKLGSDTGEKAGISGVGNKSDSVRAWFGGSYQDALSDPANVGCIFYNDGSGQLSKGGIKWESNGNLKVNAEVTATSGTIGGFNIIQTAIQARQDGKTRLLIDTGDVPPKSQLSTVVNDPYPLYLYIKNDFIGIDGSEYILDPDNNYAHTVGWDRQGPIAQIDNSKIDLYTEILNLPAGRSVSFNLGMAYTRKITLYNPNKLTGDPAFADLYTMQIIAPDGSVLQSNLNFRQGIVEFNTPVAGDYKITLKGTAVLDKANADANIRSAYTTIKFSIPANIILSTTFDSRTIIGTNGMTSFWGTDNYLYYSKDDGFEVKKGANSLIVDAGGVKIIPYGDTPCLPAPLICGGTVDVTGKVTNHCGYLYFSCDLGATGVMRINHLLGNTQYMVSAMAEADDCILQVITRSANYFEIKIRKTGSPAFAPFSFSMISLKQGAPPVKND